MRLEGKELHYKYLQLICQNSRWVIKIHIRTLEREVNQGASARKSKKFTADLIILN